jgi:EAL domain-containing protein (putative c-di-GMP-specific phosphodiesterase class I)
MAGPVLANTHGRGNLDSPCLSAPEVPFESVAKRKLTWTLTEGAAQRGVRRLRQEDFGVVFQPIVEIATGRAFAQEALVRCRNLEYPTPPELFEAAAKEEACGRLGRMIREIAFETCGDIALFVNLHPQELSSRWLVQPDDPIGFHSKPVYLEITESAALTHFDLCREVLKELCRRTGARLVVYDFGAGYSNLERVVDLEPEVIKLDLALTRDIQNHKPKQIVVRHMVNMCRELGARVVAEGVEALDELRCVRDLGVQYAQGYLLAYPAAPPPTHAWPLEVAGAAAPVSRRGPPPLPPRRGPPLPAPTAPRPSSKSPSARRSAGARQTTAPPPAKAKTPSARAPKPIPRG